MRSPPATTVLLTAAAAILWMGTGRALSGGPQDEASTDAFLSQAGQQWSLLSTYCTACHNTTLRNGGLALDELNPAGVPENAETWRKVVRALREGTMPPPAAPHPPQDKLNAFADWMEGYLNAAAPQ